MSSLLKRILLVGLIGLVVWVTFLDRHSLFQRIRWHVELRQVEAENERLLREIEDLEAAVEEGLSDEQVERIAREQYGMQRPDETVYTLQER